MTPNDPGSCRVHVAGSFSGHDSRNDALDRGGLHSTPLDIGAS
jgi:hypothetical protein